MGTSFAKHQLRVFSAIALAALVPLGARAQFVADVNGLFEDPYIVRCCNGNLTITNNYPSQAIIDDQLTAAGGTQFADRHDLLFSTDNGASARAFVNTQPFDVSVGLVLQAGSITPRKEAGIRINSSVTGDTLFIVNSDAQEIVAFGGGAPFYSFNTSNGISYSVGQPITMRMIYSPPGADPTTMPGTIEYLVNYGGTQYDSGKQPYTNLEKTFAGATEVGVYAQGARADASDFFTATYTNFVFGTGIAGVDGDYNDNGVVDAADYVIWRDNLDTSTTLPNDTTPGTVVQADYDVWRANFGLASVGSGVSVVAVPEPGTAISFGVGALCLVGLFCRRGLASITVGG